MSFSFEVYTLFCPENMLIIHKIFYIVYFTTNYPIGPEILTIMVYWK